MRTLKNAFETGSGFLQNCKLDNCHLLRQYRSAVLGFTRDWPARLSLNRPSWFCCTSLVQFSFAGLKPFIFTVRALVLLINYPNWRGGSVCTTRAIISVASHS